MVCGACGRYSGAFWGSPSAVSGSLYALFQLALRYYFYCVLPPTDRPVRLSGCGEAWRGSQLWLSGLAAVACGSICRHMPCTWRCEAVRPCRRSRAWPEHFQFARRHLPTFGARGRILLLLNWDGHHGVPSWRALHKRFRMWGALVHGGIVSCARFAARWPSPFSMHGAAGPARASICRRRRCKSGSSGRASRRLAFIPF